MEINFVDINTEHSITHELFFISGNITLNDIINKANEFNVPCKINIEYECENDNIRKLNDSFIYNHIRNKFIDNNSNKKVVGVKMIITKNYGKIIDVKFIINYIMI